MCDGAASFSAEMPFPPSLHALNVRVNSRGSSCVQSRARHSSFPLPVSMTSRFSALFCFIKSTSSWRSVEMTKAPRDAAETEMTPVPAPNSTIVRLWRKAP